MTPSFGCNPTPVSRTSLRCRPNTGDKLPGFDTLRPGQLHPLVRPPRDSRHGVSLAFTRASRLPDDELQP